MKTLKRFSAAFVLSTVFWVVALAGEMSTPPCTGPGEVPTIPCAAPGETSARPGETHGPSFSEVVGVGIAVALDLALF
jgi:hypothetical protein